MAVSYGSSWTCLTYVPERAESLEKRQEEEREGERAEAGEEA